ncbi:MAG: RHS repeat-associated core domain-containing protein [Phycisphaerales bacterium]|nr:RHS repeat-associated core domain-containing protein [Phycisphaerales bacterium]
MFASAPFSGDFFESYGYNDRNELAGSEFFLGTRSAGTSAAAGDRAYAYDPIGNRTESTTGTSAAVYYCANELNQYEALDDSAGCETPFTREFTYDADGNMTADADLVLVYDGENRLVEVAPASPGNGDKKAVFVYDYRNRRVQRTVYEHNGSAWGGSPVARTRYVWDGWLLIAELDGLASNAPLRTFWWGLDLAGQRGGRPGDAAGGIGGLLAVWDRTATEDYDEMGGGLEDGRKWVFAYDALGNVGQMVDLFPERWQPEVILAARYEYDPYGNVTAAGGGYADRNRFRFSTKQFEAESGLGYWGERFYHPEHGRWVNRDPIGEEGGTNLYSYVKNRPSHLIDARGLVALQCALTELETQPDERPAESDDALPSDSPKGRARQVRGGTILQAGLRACSASDISPGLAPGTNQFSCPASLNPASTAWGRCLCAFAPLTCLRHYCHNCLNCCMAACEDKYWPNGNTACSAACTMSYVACNAGGACCSWTPIPY